jgi:hypothetical protein
VDYKKLMGYEGKPKKKIVKKHKSSLTENLKKEFGNVINEGPAYEYRKDINNIDKSYKLYAKACLDFYEKLRKKGLDKEASSLIQNFKKNIITFKKTFEKIARKLM